MVTIFACPKPFANLHIAIIQRNAITSWTLLRPRPEIILFADEPGTAKICRELELRDVPEVARNEYGTPLVNDLFAKAQKMAAHPLLCYVNADIILMSSFMEAVRRVAALGRPFLMGGRRWNVPVQEPLTFDEAWEKRLKARIAREGQMDSPRGIDYFLFPKHLWGEIPPFAIGRYFWDNWLPYEARKNGAWLMDATEAVRAVHQEHSSRKPNFDNLAEIAESPELRRNLELTGGLSHVYTLMEATHRLGLRRMRRWLPGTLKIHAPYRAARQGWSRHVWYPLLVLTYPLRHPWVCLGWLALHGKKGDVGHSAPAERRGARHVL